MSQLIVLYAENYCENQNLTMRLLVVTHNVGLMIHTPKIRLILSTTKRRLQSWKLVLENRREYTEVPYKCAGMMYIPITDSNFFSKKLALLDSFRYNYNRKSFGLAFNRHG